MQLSYVYILKCSDGTYYTGVSSNLSQKIIEHQSGKHRSSYTYSRRPVSLAFFAEFTDINLAINSEKQIKKWSRAKKETLINGEFELLPYLSKKILDKNGSRYKMFFKHFTRTDIYTPNVTSSDFMKCNEIK